MHHRLSLWGPAAAAAKDSCPVVLWARLSCDDMQDMAQQGSPAAVSFGGYLCRWLILLKVAPHT